jgi:hypothetical protein
VHEHLELNITPSHRTVIEFEFEIEAYPEPKALDSADLIGLIDGYGGFKQTARAIGGVSEGFIRQNMNIKRKN